MAALTCLAVHHPDTLAQLDALPLDLLVNAGALQQRAAALAALATSADLLPSTEVIPETMAPPPSARRSPLRPALLHSKPASTSPATSPSTR